MSSAGVVNLPIRSLSLTSRDFLVVGVIIAKRNYKTFISKKGELKDGSEIGVWGFTLRDSPADYINVTVWGTPQFVEGLWNNFRVGDVVDLANVRVKTEENKESSFEPFVTSFLELVVSETVSAISLHASDDCLPFLELLRIPTKPPNKFVSISKVKSRGKDLVGQFINLLVAVQRLGHVREFQSQSGDKGQLIEIVVMDPTSSGFLLQSYETDTILRAQVWEPRNTVLFISDVKMEWDEYKRSLIGRLCGRSIITENPDTREAFALIQHCKTMPAETVQMLDCLANKFIQPDDIVNIMSCHAVLTKAMSGEEINTFTAVVYGIVHIFEIDIGPANIISSKCSGCGRIVESGTCMTESCSEEAQPLVLCFDFRIALTDPSAMLNACRLTGDAANNAVQVSPENFRYLDHNDVVTIKWRWLLKNVAAKLVIHPANNDKGFPVISVVGMRPVTLTEYFSNSPVYCKEVMH